MAKQFPDYADALIKPLLNDPAEFKRVVGSNMYYLKAIEKQFPGYESILRNLTHNPILRIGMFSQLDASQSGGNPLTEYQQSLLNGFVGGYRN